MRRGRLAVPVIALTLAVAVGPAWGQGARGERQFNQQLNKVRQQVQPHFRDIRGQFANLRAQGINTSGWERQLNQAEAMLNNLRWQPGMGSGQGTGFQSINPFGDFLFSGVPITPAPGGKLVTRHLDPTGLAQRAEEWARALSDPYQLISRAHEMAGDLRAINEQLNARQGAERQKFLADLGQAMALAHIEQRELKAADLGGGGRELKPKGVGEDTSGLPVLSKDTPMLLRDPFGDASRASGQDDAKPVDRIYVPLPPPQISPMDACAGAVGCMAAAGVGEGVRWAQDKYWDARTWANDPMHREWLGDAATIATMPLLLGGSGATVGARQLEFDFVSGLAGAPNPVYPPFPGFLGDAGPASALPRAILDRWGPLSGKFLSPEGTPWVQRSLPAESAISPYTRWIIEKPFDLSAGQTRPWFGWSGGGWAPPDALNNVQLFSPKSVEQLWHEGFIRPVLRPDVMPPTTQLNLFR